MASGGMSWPFRCLDHCSCSNTLSFARVLYMIVMGWGQHSWNLGDFRRDIELCEVLEHAGKPTKD